MTAARAALLAACALAAGGAAALEPPEQPASLAECERAVRRHPRELEAWDCWGKLLNARTSALRPTLEALRRLHAREPGNPYAQLMLGVFLNNQGGDDSERLYRAAAEGFRAAGDVRAEGRARIFLYATACDAGRCAEVAQDRARAEELARRSATPDQLGFLHYFRALHAFHDADFGEAARLFEQAKVGAARSPWLRHRAIDGLAAVLGATGRHRQAFEEYRAHLEQPLELFHQALRRHGLATEAVWLAGAGQMPWEEADRIIAEALDTQIRAGMRHYQDAGEFSTRLLLGLRLGATPEGIAQVERALALGVEDGHPELQIRAARLLALLLSERDPARPERPLLLATGSIEHAERTVRRRDVALGLLARSQVRWRSGKRDEGVRDALRALDAFDEVRLRQLEEMLRALSSSESASAYQLVSGWLLDPARGTPDPELAFAVMERLRARVLLDALTAARDQVLPAELRDERAALLGRISQAQQALLREQQAPQRQAVLGELAALEAKDGELRDRIARAFPRLAAPRGPPPPLSAVQAALHEGEALLAFQTWAPQGGTELPYGDGSSWALLIARGSVRAFRLPDAPELERQARILVALLARRDGSEAEGAARLYDQLLAGPLRELPREVRRLVLVPDGPLHWLPFDALRESPGGPLVAERLALSAVPSAALWLRLRHAPRPLRPAALALADPELGVAASALGLRPLPYAREEARIAVRSLGGTSRLEVGSAASERFLKSSDLSAYGVLHLAAHALVDEERPERSAVVLAPGAPDEDGLLQMREAAGLSLGGGAVVLAACRSSSGAVLRGEGPLSLARAFFQAGAHAVIGSLWEVRDDESAALFSAFYGALGRGRPIAEALAEARRERLRAGAPAAAWAGFTVMGDGDLARVAASTAWAIWAAAAAGVLAAAAFAWRFASRKAS